MENDNNRNYSPQGKTPQQNKSTESEVPGDIGQDIQNQDRTENPHFNKRETAHGDIIKSDPRESANTGSWDDLREQSTPKQGGYDPNSNDNTGGAGSTGSAATNS